MANPSFLNMLSKSFGSKEEMFFTSTVFLVILIISKVWQVLSNVACIVSSSIGVAYLRDNVVNPAL